MSIPRIIKTLKRGRKETDNNNDIRDPVEFKNVHIPSMFKICCV